MAAPYSQLLGEAPAAPRVAPGFLLGLAVGCLFLLACGGAQRSTVLVAKPAVQSRVVVASKAPLPPAEEFYARSSGPAPTALPPAPAAVAPRPASVRLSPPLAAGLAFVAAGLAAALAQQRVAMAAASGSKAPKPAPEDGDDGLLLGAAGTVANIIFAVSLAKLFNTGCGLPPGPFGLYGLAEGLSYLGVPALFAYSIYTKVKTGSGLPAGKFGLLGLAEGLSFLTVLTGVAVLVNQVTNYGFIPNAIPVEGGVCS